MSLLLIAGFVALALLFTTGDWLSVSALFPAGGAVLMAIVVAHASGLPVLPIRGVQATPGRVVVRVGPWEAARFEASRDVAVLFEPRWTGPWLLFVRPDGRVGTAGLSRQDIHDLAALWLGGPPNA